MRIIGRGGMGMVWLARDEELGEEIALKFLPEAVLLDATSREELKRETRRSRKLAHPNIVKVYDFVSDGLAAAISMEFVDGDTLSGWRARQKEMFFEVREIEPWIKQMLDALIYAHEDAKIVHRDLKPANVMVNVSGRVKVTDFGIASSISETVNRVTIQRGSSGTLAYMSPQQMMGEAPSVRDDIYAFGATIYELLTGKPPFYRGDMLAQLQGVVPCSMAQRRGEFGIDGEPIPDEWEQTVAACLAKDRAQRPQSFPEVAERLGLGAAPGTTPAPRPPPPTAGYFPSLPPPPEPSGKGWLIGVGVAVAVLILGGLGYYFGVSTAPKPASANPNSAPTIVSTPSAAPPQGQPGGNTPNVAENNAAAPNPLLIDPYTLKFNYVDGVSMKLQPKGYHKGPGSNPVQITDNPNDVFLDTPVYFDQHTGKTVHYSVESAQPLAKLLYTGKYFKIFVIEVLDPSGQIVARAGPYSYNEANPKPTTIELPLPMLKKFDVVIHNNEPDWLLIENIRFEGPGAVPTPAQSASVSPGAQPTAAATQNAATGTVPEQPEVPVASPPTTNYATPCTVTTLAGSAGYAGTIDGAGNMARFNGLNGLALDGSGNLYVADMNNNTIRKVTPDGVVSTLAGLAANPGSSDGTGIAARFNKPATMVLDGSGNIYVADSGNNTIRKITPGGVVSTLAGSADNKGCIDGIGGAARFNNPFGLAMDSSGTLYVSEWGNDTIRKITPDGTVLTVAGSPGHKGSSDGTGSAARFNTPVGVAVDNRGTLYVADTFNQTIRKITPDGVVSTLAGSAGQVGSMDGMGSAARFNRPCRPVLDSSGNLYVAEFLNCTVRKVTPGGVVTTLAGSAGVEGCNDGAGSAARFKNPCGLASDSSGNLYLADSGNNTIRKITFGGAAPTTPIAPSETPTGAAPATTTNSPAPSPVACTIILVAPLEAYGPDGELTDVSQSVIGQSYQCLRVENGKAVLRDQSGQIFKIRADAVSQTPAQPAAP